MESGPTRDSQERQEEMARKARQRFGRRDRVEILKAIYREIRHVWNYVILSWIELPPW
jgi:hypothetical protein